MLKKASRPRSSPHILNSVSITHLSASLATHNQTVKRKASFDLGKHNIFNPWYELLNLHPHPPSVPIYPPGSSSSGKSLRFIPQPYKLNKSQSKKPRRIRNPIIVTNLREIVTSSSEQDTLGRTLLETRDFMRSTRIHAVCPFSHAFCSPRNIRSRVRREGD